MDTKPDTTTHKPKEENLKHHKSSYSPESLETPKVPRILGIAGELKRKGLDMSSRPRFADRARFELAVGCPTTVFKTVSLGRSDTCPYVRYNTWSTRTMFYYTAGVVMRDTHV